MSRWGAAGAAAIAAAALLPAADAARAQEPTEPDRRELVLTLHAGGTAFTRFQNVTLEAAGSPQGSYPASIAASAAAGLGADLTAWFTPWLGTRLHFAYAPSSFEVRLSAEDREEVLGEDADYQRLRYSDLSTFNLSAALVLALPFTSTHVAPYALLGVGGALYGADDRGARGLETAFEGHRRSLRIAGVAGAGLKIPLESARVSLSFEITDHVTASPISGDDGRILLDAGDVRVVNRAHPTAVSARTRWVHAVGFTAGLSFATGPARRPVAVPADAPQ